MAIGEADNWRVWTLAGIKFCWPSCVLVAAGRALAIVVADG